MFKLFGQTIQVSLKSVSKAIKIMQTFCTIGKTIAGKGVLWFVFPCHVV